MSSRGGLFYLQDLIFELLIVANIEVIQFRSDWSFKESDKFLKRMANKQRTVCFCGLNKKKIETTINHVHITYGPIIMSSPP